MPTVRIKSNEIKWNEFFSCFLFGREYLLLTKKELKFHKFFIYNNQLKLHFNEIVVEIFTVVADGLMGVLLKEEEILVFKCLFF